MPIKIAGLADVNIIRYYSISYKKNRNFIKLFVRFNAVYEIFDVLLLLEKYFICTTIIKKQVICYERIL